MPQLTNTLFERYHSPLDSKYSSVEMSRLFSAKSTFLIWRYLWWALLENQSAFVSIPEEAMQKLRKHLEIIPFDKIEEWENLTHHDVMAHIHVLEEQCPEIAGYLHLGVTSAFIKDNTDLFQMKCALEIIQKRTQEVLEVLQEMMIKYKKVVCNGYTHFQKAQLITFGKRVLLWAQSLWQDMEDLLVLKRKLPFRGMQGTLGTGDTFLELLSQSYSSFSTEDLYRMYRNMNKNIERNFGFESPDVIYTGQTYDRKWDVSVVSLLKQIAISAHKFSNDFRLLQHEGEVAEFFSEKQVGSSAMPYKRNPILTERMSSLSKYVFAQSENATWVAATQWLERTLDDSANRRMALPEIFLATDAILLLWKKVCSQAVVHEEVMRQNVESRFPFILSERILMKGVQAGQSRQDLHEILRKKMIFFQQDKELESLSPNESVVERVLLSLKKDPDLHFLDASFFEQYQDLLLLTGFSVLQVEEFVAKHQKRLQEIQLYPKGFTSVEEWLERNKV